MRSDQKDGGQYLRLVKGALGLCLSEFICTPDFAYAGTQTISIGLAGLLKPDSIILKSPVRHIEQTPDGVYVSAGKGDYLCKRVIVSVPTPLYKDINFNPPLPEAKLELSRQNKLGYTNKVMIYYASPWWRQENLCGMLQSFTGPVAVARDSSVDEARQFSLTCFCVGKLGRDLSKLSQSQRFQVVVEHVKKTIGFGVRVPEPLALVEHEWAADQWSQGCPCPAAPPGVMTRFEHALRTSHGKVHFVGTETSYEWKGYMDGAVRSGIRGAKEVIAALERPKL
jgi:monoamine oxidase